MGVHAWRCDKRLRAWHNIFLLPRSPSTAYTFGFPPVFSAIRGRWFLPARTTTFLERCTLEFTRCGLGLKGRRFAKRKVDFVTRQPPPSRLFPSPGHPARSQSMIHACR